MKVERQVSVELVPLMPDSALLLRRFNYKRLDVKWHAHPEYEITFIRKGLGKRIIGNHVSDFGPGDLVLIGPDIPHLYIGETTQADAGAAVCDVIQFNRDLFSPQILSFTEMKRLRNLLDRSRQGLHFSGSLISKVSSSIQRMNKLSDISRLAEFLNLISVLCETEDARVLNSDSQGGLDAFDSEKGKEIYHYILNHYTEDISLSRIAAIANMSKPGFCNYFLRKTKKRFSDFINELRCEKAGRLLKETQDNIAGIAYASGFNNISYFNRKFQEYKKMTPGDFRKQYQSKRNSHP